MKLWKKKEVVPLVSSSSAQLDYTLEVIRRLEQVTDRLENICKKANGVAAH